MQPKKNPKADLAKSSGLFFAIGFAIVSGLSLWGFEAKMYDKAKQDDRQSEVNKALDEDQENFVVEAPDTPPPPPPPPASPGSSTPSTAPSTSCITNPNTRSRSPPKSTTPPSPVLSSMLPPDNSGLPVKMGAPSPWGRTPRRG